MTTGNIEAIYPLTPVQDGILFHTLFAPESPLYIQQYTAQLDGTLDVDAFRSAWDLVIGRHAVLRSLLTWEGRERPLQLVKKQVEPEWLVEDWTQDQGTQESRLDTFLEVDRARGFKLDEAPLMRFALFQLSDNATQFVWSHHHIIIDGWSMGIVLDEVMRSYEALSTGGEPELGPVADYRSYVTWLHERDASGDEAWWRESLSGVAQATPLPIERISMDSPWAERHEEHLVRLDSAATSRLTDFARTNGLTINTVVRGAWSLVLARYSGHNEVLYGATVAGRPPEVDGALDMVGLFINTLPVRSVIEPTSTVRDWLSGLQRSQSEMAPYESTPLVDVQRWSDTPQGEPLFTSLLVFENVPVPESATGGLSSSKVRYLQRSNYPFAVLVMPGSEIEFIVLYDADRYDSEIIERLAGQLVHTLSELIADPNRQVGSIDVMPPREAAEILRDWNATEAPYPSDSTMYDLIAEQAAAHPDETAVIDATGSITYAELIERAGVVGEHLAGLGVGRNDRVGIAMERSAAMVTAIVGVLSAGGAYVPIDPEAPEARRRFLLADTDARALILDVEGPSDDIPTITVDWSGAAVSTPDARRVVNREASPDDLAYVLYTSGSTGQPKGVAVTNRNLVNSTNARLGAYGEPVGRFLLLSPFHFDSSVAGIFSSLSQGGTLVLPGKDQEKDVVHLAELVAKHGVTHTLALPSLYEVLLEHGTRDQLGSLRLIMVAGEACSPAVVEQHFAKLPECRLVNEYGPTEATVWCTVHDIAPTDVEGRIPIGKPIANTTAYVLDSVGRPAPVGVPGELHIGGVNVTSGYLGQDELTAERFVEVNLRGGGPERVYRTGDVVRWLPDGSLDLLGRVDHQVKIRGQRIELGEIEAVLRAHPSVREAVAVVHEPEGGTTVIVGYVEGSVDVEVLKGHVASQLPAVMVPSVVMALDELPRGRTGKVARDELPEPNFEPATGESFVAPTTEAEMALASIWEAVLGVERVGLTDNFFDLGGDSILSIRIIARAHERGLRLTPRQFFDSPTVGELARIVEG